MEAADSRTRVEQEEEDWEQRWVQMIIRVTALYQSELLLSQWIHASVSSALFTLAWQQSY